MMISKVVFKFLARKRKIFFKLKYVCRVLRIARFIFDKSQNQQALCVPSCHFDVMFISQERQPYVYVKVVISSLWSGPIFK